MLKGKRDDLSSIDSAALRKEINDLSNKLDQNARSKNRMVGP